MTCLRSHSWSEAKLGFPELSDAIACVSFMCLVKKGFSGQEGLGRSRSWNRTEDKLDGRGLVGLAGVYGVEGLAPTLLATLTISLLTDDAHGHFHECNCNQWCCAWYVTGASWRGRGLDGWEGGLGSWKEGQRPGLWVPSGPQRSNTADSGAGLRRFRGIDGGSRVKGRGRRC